MIISTFPPFCCVRLSDHTTSQFGVSFTDITLFHTIELYFSLTGTIPKEISMMSNLQHFIAFGNNLTGTIPPIETMSELKGLLVYSNSLTGTIPEFLGDMESLDAVIISDNDISGTIPTELAKLNNLLWLGLEYMELDGTIPSALAQLPSLQNLQLSKFV